MSTPQLPRPGTRVRVTRANGDETGTIIEVRTTVLPTGRSDLLIVELDSGHTFPFVPSAVTRMG